MVSLVRVCSICEHFNISLGEPGYSEWTPGSPGSVWCSKSYNRDCPWDVLNDNVEAARLRSVAEKCPYFEVHSDLEIAEGGE